jgi:hypothetical protein
MGYCDGVSGENNLLFLSQCLFGDSAAHITANCMDLFTLKNIQDGQVNEISGMNDCITPSKSCEALPYEGLIYCIKMGVGENSYRDHCFVPIDSMPTIIPGASLSALKKLFY